MSICNCGKECAARQIKHHDAFRYRQYKLYLGCKNASFDPFISFHEVAVFNDPQHSSATSFTSGTDISWKSIINALGHQNRMSLKYHDKLCAFQVFLVFGEYRQSLADHQLSLALRHARL